jgi:hypothetical protein
LRLRWLGSALFLKVKRAFGSRKELAMALADFIKVQKFLSGIHYPATKEQLIEQARRNKADKDALEALNDIPEREYSGPDEVSKAVAKG